MVSTQSVKLNSLGLVAVLMLLGCGSGTNSSPVATSIPTYEEYKAAATAAAECMTVAGVSTIAVEDKNGSISMQMESGTVTEQRANEIYDDCVLKHLSTIQDAYLQSIRPTPDETRTVMAACLLDAGVIQNDDATQAEMVQVVGQLSSTDPVYIVANDCLETAFGG